MIWTITSILLYLIIAAVALVVIVSEDPGRGKDGYYDVRNIFPALFWWLVLLSAGMGWVFRKAVKKAITNDQSNQD